MRRLSLALAACLFAAPALAQVPPAAAPPATGSPAERGRTTPDPSAAHRGGGVVLEGAPGAPAPAPQVTPPLPPAPSPQPSAPMTPAVPAR